MSVEELLALHDREQRVRRKASADNLVVQAAAYWRTASARLHERKASRVNADDPARTEAFRIVEDDACVISIKVQSAIESRFRLAEGSLEFFYGDPNEIATLAVALIERSERAWRTIAEAGDEKASVLARQLVVLRALLEEEYPAIGSSPARGCAVLPRLGASGPTVASLEARISALEKRIDGLTRGMRRFRKQAAPPKSPRRKR